MAILRYAGDKITCLSGDTKPLNIADGAQLYETDTLKIYLKVAGAWSEVTGYSGYSGFSGYSGISGYSGYSGISGYSGVDGTNGTSGYSGYSGISGYSGADGAEGTSGFSGFSGISGYSGVDGATGTSGFSGYSGYSGLSGFSGYSGLDGGTGTSGYSGYSGISGYSGTPGALVGITFYTDDNASDIGGYRNALRAPDADPEVQYGAVGDGTGVVIEEFASISGDPNTTLIESGTWRANVYAYLLTGGGTNSVIVSVYKRAAGGSETLLFSMETPSVTGVGHGNTALYEVLSSQSEFVILATDRIVFKYLAKSSDGDTVSICVGGGTHYSHVHTPLITQGYSGFSGISGYSGYSGISGYSGYSGISGFSGADGATGDTGISGYSGFSGYSGISGYSGADGATGTSGYSGISGYSGATGAEGTSGYSGYSGISGYSGAEGTQFDWKGAWVVGTAYVLNDCVEYNGSGYVAIQAGTGNTPDPAGTAYWDLLVEAGTSGYSGISGYSGYSGAGIQYWDRAGSIITPSNAGDTVNLATSPLLQAVQSVPGTPAADNMITYVKGSGTTPNRVVSLCTKDEAGNEVVISSVVV